MKKRLYGLLLAGIMVLSLSVNVFAETVDSFGGYEAADFEASAVGFLEETMTLLGGSEDDISSYVTYYEQYGMEAIASGIEQFAELKDELGEYQEAGEFAMETSDDDSLHTELDFTCEGGAYTLTIDYDSSLSVTQISVESAKGSASIGEQLKEAGLNTVLGLVVVFAVLLFISFLISLFRFLPKSKAKQEQEIFPEQPVEIPAAAEEPACQAAEDTELVAVISAAVAAAMGTSEGDGYVVRSIRKRPR